MEILASRGSFRMTLADVGQRAGYSRGLPALHFGNKIGLLRALVPFIRQRYNEQLATVPPVTDGLETILGHLSFYFTRKDKGWHAPRAMLILMTESFMEPFELRSDMANYNREVISMIEGHIRIGMERGEIRQLEDPRMAAVLIIGLMRGAILPCLVDPNINVLKIRNELLEMVDSYLVA